MYLLLEQLKFGALSTILSYWPLDVQHGTSLQRTLFFFFAEDNPGQEHELLEPCPVVWWVYKVNLFDLDGVQHVWWRPGEEYQENCALPTVKHGGGSIMVWGCMSAAGTGELRFIEGNMDSNMYCDILKQKMMPSLQKLFSNITTTPNTPPRWQLPCFWRWGEGDGVAKYVSRPEPYWAHVGHPQTEGEKQLRDVIMEEWKRMPATTCAALVNSMPRRIKAVLDNNDAPTKYWHFGHSFDLFT